MNFYLFQVGIVFLLIWGVLGNAFASFIDVEDSFPFQEAISFMEDKGIIRGYSDGTFRPNNPVNRAELLKMIIKSKGVKPKPCMRPPFQDTPLFEWYTPYLCQSKEEGIIEGYPDGTFRPAQPLTFAETAKILVKMFPLASESAFSSDVEGASWYEPYVTLLQNFDIVPDSITSPAHHPTRGEIAEMLYRIISITSPEKVSQRIEVVLPQKEFILGEPISIQLVFPDLPEDAYVGIFLKPDLQGYHLSQGPLTKKAVSVKEHNFLFTWDGEEVFCAPLDVITTCPVNPGKYHLKAYLYNAPTDLVRTRTFSRVARRPELPIKEGKSKPFYLLLASESEEEALVEKYIKPFLKNAIFVFLKKNFVGSLRETFSLHVSHHLFSDIVEEDSFSFKEGRYCLTVEVKLPFARRLQACTKKDAFSKEGVKVLSLADIEVEGDIREAANLFQNAFKAAIAKIQLHYADRVAHLSQPDYMELLRQGYKPHTPEDAEYYTYLSLTLRDWRYDENTKQYLFLVNAIKAGGLTSGPDRFSDIAVVGVNREGKACLLEVVPKQEYKKASNAFVAPDICQ